MVAFVPTLLNAPVSNYSVRQHFTSDASEKLSLTLRLLMSYIYIYIYMEHPFLMFLDHTRRRTTVGRTPLDEWSACRRDLYLTTHDTHNRQISMPPVGFKPKISAGERPQAARMLRYRARACVCVCVCVTKNWVLFISVHNSPCL